ncbi:OmpH family outer membrane protein [Puteibacter caeruleilacunae]|nr:OmpH family outer membrane protein [Puteibacter caeruleilacunae]
MKKTSLIVNAILAVAVLVIYVLHFSGNTGASTSGSNNTVKGDGSLSVAYIKLDSLLVNYELAQDLHEEFTQKQEAYNKEYGVKRQEFEKEAVAFQEKLQRGGFLSQDRAIKERDRLAGQEKEVQQLDYELSNKLQEIQQANNTQLFDSITSYLNEYNEKHNFTYILNSTNVLVGEEGLNVTGDVLNALNGRYTSKAEKEGK